MIQFNYTNKQQLLLLLFFLKCVELSSPVFLCTFERAFNLGKNISFYVKNEQASPAQV